MLIAPIISKGQQQNLPLNREFGLVNQKVFNAFGNNVHTSFQPINQSAIKNISDSILSDSEHKFYLANVKKSEKKSRNFFKWMYQSLFFENFLAVDTGRFYMSISPQWNLEMGKDSEDKSGRSLYKNTRGVIVRANVGENFSFETSLYENQMALPDYLDDYANSTKVIPGQGRWKRFKSDQGYDFSSASANISYSPSKHFNFQLGTGKNFVGDGYRSLLLSDASFNYPFWKIITTFGKKDQFQYTKLNASLSSVTRREDGSTGEALFQRKSMSTHYFSWLATKWLNLGLFESTMWQTEDSTGTKPLQWQQFNPVIGVNTATTGFNDVNHTVVGTNLKIKLPFKAVIYNQFVYDGASKYGYQIGAKYFGIPNLTLQAEYNNTAAYTYSSDTRLQAYSNYNEPLAHPSGANFNEVIGIINYKYKRVFTQAKINLINSDIIGGNIFISENNSPPFVDEEGNLLSTPNIDTKLTIIQAHLGFLINPKNNMSIIIGLTKRTENIPSFDYTHETNYLYFGFRTSLRNLYNDF
ncbi:MAG: hypothetical protein COB15_01020 [Flavobacteriales bacterium]|nr:MAG: hypothetical protein COB15_01020 [Flavobacteriales bacterium]